MKILVFACGLVAVYFLAPVILGVVQGIVIVWLSPSPSRKTLLMREK